MLTPVIEMKSQPPRVTQGGSEKIQVPLVEPPTFR